MRPVEFGGEIEVPRNLLPSKVAAWTEVRKR
jgi:hypothetical protein